MSVGRRREFRSHLPRNPNSTERGISGTSFKSVLKRSSNVRKTQTVDLRRNLKEDASHAFGTLTLVPSKSDAACSRVLI